MRSISAFDRLTETARKMSQEGKTAIFVQCTCSTCNQPVREPSTKMPLIVWLEPKTFVTTRNIIIATTMQQLWKILIQELTMWYIHLLCVQAFVLHVRL